MLSFYGAKWRAALHYPAPKHTKIIEPFAGSAGYSLRYADFDVWLNDSDPIIAAIWSWLVRATVDEILTLPDLAPDQTVDDLPIIQEARWFIGFWLNPGSSTPKKKQSTWGREYANQSQIFWGSRVRLRVAQQVNAIRHWRVTCKDYEELPNMRGTWFVDPPYSCGGYAYRNAVIDYPHLAEWCRKRVGQTIVCERAGASWLPFLPLGTFKATFGPQKAAQVTHEVIWTR